MEFAFDLSLIACHLSGWAEEWILWSTSEFGFLRLPEQFCTGSSIMPHKINPDVLELVRGKSARSIGNLQTLLTLIKGLPLAYNRDLQEDKPALFDSFDNVLASCQLAAPIVAGMTLRHDVIKQSLVDGYLDATTLMEHLIRAGTPQRTAHQLVGTVVRFARDSGKQLSDLSLAEFHSLGANVDESVYDVLGTQNAIDAFRSVGSTARNQVAAQISRWREDLDHGNSKAT